MMSGGASTRLLRSFINCTGIDTATRLYRLPSPIGTPISSVLFRFPSWVCPPYHRSKLHRWKSGIVAIERSQ